MSIYGRHEYDDVDGDGDGDEVKYQNCHLVLKGSLWFFLVLFLVLFSSVFRFFTSFFSFLYQFFKFCHDYKDLKSRVL